MADVTARQPCPQAECLIAAGLESRVLVPGDDLYAARIGSYWCNSTKLQPSCIVQPCSTSEVATAIKALAGAQQVFAVRSGGHMNWAGSNNIDGGVTVDLGLISSVSYDPNTETADIGPAAKWKHVYEELEKHERVVVGGREAEVGVGGLLLGGGNTFYTGRHGFACDNVVAYEVVLAGGDVVTARADGAHADLFRALKGGGNNFGIVTRFTVRTLPQAPGASLWGGVAVKPTVVMSEAAPALAAFTARAHEDPDSSLNFTVAHVPRFGGGAVIAICTNVAGVEDPPAFEQFAKLPTTMNLLKMSSMQELIAYSSLPNDYYNIWYTLTFKNDVSIINKANELHSQLVDQVREKASDGDFNTHCSFQPMPKAFFAQKGAGNMLGLEKYASDAIMIQASASVRTKELADWVRPKVRAVVEGVRAFAEGIEDGVCPWLHLNYASPDQPVLRSYGEENVRFMREVAHKYDADGVFQRLCPGGFKVSAVTD